MQKSMASNTFQTYNTALSVYNTFLDNFKLLKRWPAPHAHIILFIAHCFESGLAAKTVKTYISGLNYYHKLYGCEGFFNNFIIKKLVEGYNRSVPSKDMRVPVTFPLLSKLTAALPVVCSNSYEATLFASIWVLAYFGLFRVSELVAISRYAPGNHFKRTDAFVDPDLKYLTLRLGKHKSNQTNATQLLRIPAEPLCKLCPVTVFQRYLKARPSVPGPLFCHIDGQPVTRYQFAVLLSRCASQAGLADQTIRTHSFRMGRATDLAARAVPVSAIMKLGRWSSDAYKLYIR